MYVLLQQYLLSSVLCRMSTYVYILYETHRELSFSKKIYTEVQLLCEKFQNCSARLYLSTTDIGDFFYIYTMSQCGISSI